jgi:isoleucyl-tRNA synthetase
VLLEVCKLSAPVAPFLPEQIYLNLVEPLKNPELISVHLDSFPEKDEKAIDKSLENLMGNVQNIVSLGLAARKNSNIKVRQPLSEILVSISGETDSSSYEQLLNHVYDELNVKNIKFVNSLDKLAVYNIKPVFKNLGPKFGKEANKVAEILKALNPEEALKFKTDGVFKVSLNGNSAEVEASDVEFVTSYSSDYEVVTEGDISIALNVALTDELRDEGFAREMVNKVQNMRKMAGFNVTDKIEIGIDCGNLLNSAIEKNKEYICNETLSESIRSGIDGGDLKKEWNLNGEDAVISVKKISG